MSGAAILPQTLEPQVNGQFPPDNLVPPADPVLSVSYIVTVMPVVAVSHHSSLERPGSPVFYVFAALHPVSKIGSMDQVSGSPKISYARVVAGANTPMVVEPSPSLDDVIVNSDDVKVDRSGPFTSFDFSERVHDHIDHSMRRSLIVRLLGRSIGYKMLMGSEASCSDSVQASVHREGHPEVIRVEKEVYGPWMLAPSRFRQSRKDNNLSKGTSSIPGSSGGSRFAMLGNNADMKLVPAGGRVELDTAACS
ncbi:hypothetical protein V6N12_009247 [Hibiscus sabdariffa]|uniref:Uncharacterized protein n=1 Tax=Hibiscus sabdariffa TaxID=183260 RepID=A0ABR2BK63_9ROSI